MDTELRAADSVDAGTDDDRWAAWVAKGVRQDKKTKKRAIGTAAVIAGGLGLWLVLAFLLG